MKNLPTNSRSRTAGRASATSSETEGFAQNRYRKFRFQRESILLNAPESSGVYGLYSAVWIHLGEADNIRTRLLEDLSGDDPGIRIYQPSGFAFEVVSPAERSRRLQELVIELEPLCRRKASERRPAS
jgi:hypothetical protein